MSILRRAGFLLAAMLCIVCAERAFGGTCGDYLDMSHEGAAQEKSASHEGDPSGAPRCSQSDPTPIPLPAPAPVQVRPLRDAIAIVEQASGAEFTSEAFDDREIAFYSLQLPSGIFHPPRAA